MKVSKLFEGAKAICREMLWNAGLQVLTIDRVELRESFLPGQGRGEMKNQLIFRGIDPGLVITGRKLKFLVRALGGTDTAEWKGKQIGIYVDKTMTDRTGGGFGSIQFAAGPNFWEAGNYSGKGAPPPRTNGTKPRPSQPEVEADTPEVTTTEDGPPPEAIDPDNDGR